MFNIKKAYLFSFKSTFLCLISTKKKHFRAIEKINLLYMCVSYIWVTSYKFVSCFKHMWPYHMYHIGSSTYEKKIKMSFVWNTKEHNVCYICKYKFAVKTLHLFSEGRVFSYHVECMLKIKITFLEGGIKHHKPNSNFLRNHFDLIKRN